MKHLILLPFFIGIICALKAQITITQSDVPQVGTTAYEANDTMPSYGAGAGGASQTWVFTSPTIHYGDTVNFMNPSSAPAASSFPTANLAAYQTFADAYMYFNTSASIVDMLGAYGIFSGVGPIAVVFNPTEPFITLPSTYQTSFSGTRKYRVTAPYTQMANVDSVRVKSRTTYNSSIDGWGQVTTPVGTFDCLRQMIVENSLDSTEIYINIVFPPYEGWQDYQQNTKTDTTYRWLSNGQQYPVAQYFINFQGSTTRKKFVYMTNAVITGKQETINEINNFRIFPNPVSDKLFVFNAGNRAASIVITDESGKLIETRLCNGKTFSVNTNSYGTGIYFCQFIGSDGKLSENIKFLIER